MFSPVHVHVIVNNNLNIILMPTTKLSLKLISELRGMYKKVPAYCFLLSGFDGELAYAVRHSDGSAFLRERAEVINDLMPAEERQVEMWACPNMISDLIQSMHCLTPFLQTCL